jgi:hypothetical protein
MPPCRVECMCEAAEIRLGENVGFDSLKMWMDVGLYNRNGMIVSPCSFWLPIVSDRVKHSYVHESPTKAFFFLL